MTSVYYLFGIAIFVAVVLAIEGAYLWWQTNKSAEAQRLAQRLKVLAEGIEDTGARFSIYKERALSRVPWLAAVLKRLDAAHALDRRLAQSGLSWTVAYFVGLTLIMAAVGFITPLFLNYSPLIAPVGAALCALLPWIHVSRTRKKRMLRIEQQLPDAVDLMARALRAGHAFPNAVKMVGDEMTNPIASEFRLLFDEVNYGVSMQEALLNLANRVPSTDLKYLVIAVLIQRETGGNLAELLNNIGGIIRARLKLFGTIRVLSAEGRLSAWILSLLPFATALLIQLVNPKFMAVLWSDPAGLKMVYVALTMMAFGVLWMRKIIRIRV
ncbi:MAG: type II secretion system F family protein [Rhodospirillaceae bacterium]